MFRPLCSFQSSLPVLITSSRLIALLSPYTAAFSRLFEGDPSNEHVFVRAEASAAYRAVCCFLVNMRLSRPLMSTSVYCRTNVIDGLSDVVLLAEQQEDDLSAVRKLERSVHPVLGGILGRPGQHTMDRCQGGQLQAQEAHGAPE